MKKVCFLSNTEWSIRLALLPHILAIQDSCRVGVVVNTSDPRFLQKLGVKGELHPIALAREIEPLRDGRNLLTLAALFRRERFDLVQSITPKGGLLAMLAARLAGVPVRVHIFTGQVWASRRGPFRLLLKSMDALLAACATHLLTDSRAQREFLIKEGVVPAEKIRVLANGSICGVDGEALKPDAALRARLRHELGLAEDEVVFLFVGRLKRDKGLLELGRAFGLLSKTRAGARLLVVGPEEEPEIKKGMLEECGAFAERLIFVPYAEAPQRYYACADVFCLPSHREGFPMGILEAAAVEVPSIGTDIYGIVDALVEGETGLLGPVGDAEALERNMARLFDDAALRGRLGRQARERALRDFSSAKVTAAFADFFRSLLASRP